MAKNKKLNNAARARMQRTGETYSTARMHVLASLDVAAPNEATGDASAIQAVYAVPAARPPLRLYRGIRHGYRPEKVHRWWTNFTDEPFEALLHARSRYGVLIVVDLHHDDPKLRDEGERIGRHARRLMITGRFDEHITAVIPAKDARAVINQRGVRGQDDRYRSDVLRSAIARWLQLDPETRASRALRDC